MTSTKCYKKQAMENVIDNSPRKMLQKIGHEQSVIENSPRKMLQKIGHEQNIIENGI